jgi:hypothetical protein
VNLKLSMILEVYRKETNTEQLLEVRCNEKSYSKESIQCFMYGVVQP